MQGSYQAKKPSPIDVLVGERVRLQRLLIGMSQGMLGATVGVTFQQMQKYEKGTNRIGASRLLRIAEALGVPVGYFFGGPAPSIPEEPAPTVGMPFMAECIRLNKAFLSIKNARLRRCIIELVRTIADAGSDEKVF